MNGISGWLLDLYEDSQGGISLWLLGEDGIRHCFRQAFPITFYIAGPQSQLNSLINYLNRQTYPIKFEYTERREISNPKPLPVLSVQVARTADQLTLFRKLSRRFPDLSYFDVDLALALRHAAAFGTFPLAHCELGINQQGQVESLTVLDSPWDLDVQQPPLRILTIEPDSDPSHSPPQKLAMRSDGVDCMIPLRPVHSFLRSLRSLLLRIDPDVIITAWGDTWLLPALLDLSQKHNFPLPLNRAPTQEVTRRPERSYFSYGQIIFRGQQIHLFGRWHIDRCNAMLWGNYALDGILETARVTGLPVQVSARCSPGTGISSMQITTALRQGILVPWHKQEAERPKTAFDLLRTDQGGMVYQPITGLHRDVGEIDFVSMYPSLMVRHNISPETMRPDSLVPETETTGLIPLTLKPLLQKRISLKARLAEMPSWHPDYERGSARSSAHKWLLVTCFGYLGYKNARFGRIEAHEAVTTWGREALLLAKEAAESLGFTVLHMYVDGLWIKKAGASRPTDFQPALELIATRTGLSISLDGIFRWIAFLPSRQDERIPVPNRYFGVFQDGSLKIRGIEARRRDTPPFIADTQMKLLNYLAQARDVDQLQIRLPGAVYLLRRQLARLRSGKVPLEQLLVSQKLSRKLDTYSSPSPGAQAAAQLAASGKSLQPGERARFLYIRGDSRVHAWDQIDAVNPAAVDLARYRMLLMRAASAVFEPLGIDKIRLNGWVIGAPVAIDWIEDQVRSTNVQMFNGGEQAIQSFRLPR